MKSSISSMVPLLVSLVHGLVVFLFSVAASSPPNYGSFLQCLSTHSHNYDDPIPIYTPNNSSFSSILTSRIQNLRFLSPKYPKPQIITTPLNEPHVQAIVICSRKHGFFIRIRSGGHDYEGLSYTSPLIKTPFLLLDLSNLKSIHVDVDEGTAWVQSGATIGQLYYRIAEKSPVHAFAAGACTTIGVGGHFSGGGNGFLTRKYGLAADNVVDARIVNVNGEILSRESMGEDLFWAIRGGGGTSFGVVLSWKINLLAVPPNVTVFTVSRTLEQGATALVHKWQYIAHKLPKDLTLFVSLTKVNASNTSTTTTGQASFQALFVGGTTDQLLEIMQQNFSELGLKRKDCVEMSWIQSVLYFAGLPTTNTSLNAFEANVLITNFKGASDFVKQPISKTGLQGIWKNIVQMSSSPVLQLQPYGGRMSEISDTSIPFPHRAGNTYKILYLVQQNQGSNDNNIEWLRRLYKYMTPYVSKSPRAAYLNVRDLDLGYNEMWTNYTPTYEEAKIWGSKYFKNNFDRLVKVKSRVDPDNFFRNEQSIPPSFT